MSLVCLTMLHIHAHTESQHSIKREGDTQTRSHVSQHKTGHQTQNTQMLMYSLQFG